jgi:hypothetical protein
MLYMHLTQKHINYLKFFGFLLMIGLMVVLNNEQKSAKTLSGKKPVCHLMVNENGVGITANASTLPEKTEGSLPLKLISNPNSNFLFLFNQSKELKNGFQFIQFQKLFFVYCSKFQSNFLIEFLATMRNKDIR